MKRYKVRWRYLIIILGLFAMVMLVRDFNSRMTELHQLSLERDRISARVTSMVATYYHLETQVALATSDLLVEEIAREDLKYGKEGDTPIILVGDAGIEPEAVPQVAPVVQPYERWELWLALFIDPQDVAEAPVAPVKLP